MPRRRFLATGLIASAIAAGAPATASAATSVSSNWAGYAVTAPRSAAGFRRVSASWVVPAGSCAQGGAGYSATWVGLGGFHSSSTSLEQIGTEFDCSASGEPSYSAWYELVPAVGRTIRLPVHPGDSFDASVTVRGKRVSLRLRNRTSRWTFARTFRMSAPDVRSAEWIVEAPSDCSDSSGRCSTLPLSNFGTVPFSGASVTTTSGRTGSIAASGWSATKIILGGGGGGDGGQGQADAASSGAATPSELSAGGSSFAVGYRDSQQTRTPN
jgi:hypothetical protein